MTKIARNWEDLIGIESETHIFEYGEGNGWIKPKDESDGEWRRHYMSTHTFYGLTHKGSTRMFQQCGFDVIIDNWDGPLPENLDTEAYLKRLWREYEHSAEKDDHERRQKILVYENVEDYFREDLETEVKKILGRKPMDPAVGERLKELYDGTKPYWLDHLLGNPYSRSRIDEDHVRRTMQNRNSLCHCESGKKFKHCCGKI